MVECLTSDRRVEGFKPHWRHCVLEQDTLSSAEVIKLFMLNSTEHEINYAHKC